MLSQKTATLLKGGRVLSEYQIRLNGKCFQVSILHWDPQFEKGFVNPLGPLQDALMLGFRFHGKQYR